LGPRPLRPLAQPGFRRLAAARLAGQLADWIFLATLVGVVYERTRSTAAVAVLMLLRLLPPLVAGVAAGVLADRVDRRRLLAGAEVARAAAAVGVLVALRLESAPLLFAAVAATGVLTPISSVALRSVVPRFVPPAELPAANAILGVGHQLAAAAGAFTAAGVLATAGAPFAIAGVAAVALCAAVLYSRLPRVEQIAAAAGQRGLRAVVRHVRARPVALAVIAGITAGTVATALVNASLPRLLAERGFGSDTYGFGFCALTAGLALGMVVTGMRRLEQLTPRTLAVALLAMAGACCALAALPGRGATIACLLAIGVCIGVAELVFESVVQREVDPALLGRVFGLAQTALVTAMAGAVAAAPAANAAGTPRQIAAFCALLLVAVGGGTLAYARHQTLSSRRSISSPVAGRGLA